MSLTCARVGKAAMIIAESIRWTDFCISLIECIGEDRLVAAIKEGAGAAAPKLVREALFR